MRLTPALALVLLAAPAACQPPDDDDAALAVAGHVIIEGPGEDAEVRIRPEGVEDFSVILGRGTFLRVVHAEGTPARAEVNGPHIAFTADARALDYHPDGSLSLWQDRVRLAPGIRIDELAVAEGRLVGTVHIDDYAEITIAGLAFPPRRLLPGPPMRARAADDAPITTPDVRAEPTRYALPTHPSLLLYAAPDDARTARFTTSEPAYTELEVLGPDEVRLDGTGIARSFSQIRWRGPSIQLTAWVLTSELTFPEGRSGGFAGGGIGCSAGTSPGPRVAALLPAGTLIYAQPGRGAWARVHTPVAVDLEPAANGQGWGRIVALPDVVGNWSTEFMWVALAPPSAAAAP